MVNYKYATIEIDNEEYHYINKQWVDEGYIIPATNVLKKIYKKILSEYKRFSDNELFEYAKEMKSLELYSEAILLIDYLLESSLGNKRNLAFVKILLPMKTSCLRSKKDPEKAIEFYEQIYDKLGEAIHSKALLVSLSSAYCDINDFGKAQYYADKAAELSKTNDELEIVYNRINANLY